MRSTAGKPGPKLNIFLRLNSRRDSRPRLSGRAKLGSRLQRSMPQGESKANLLSESVGLLASSHYFANFGRKDFVVCSGERKQGAGHSKAASKIAGTSGLPTSSRVSRMASDRCMGPAA